MKMFFDVQIDQNFMFLLNSVNEEQENRIDLMRRSMLQREGDELDDEQEK